MRNRKSSWFWLIAVVVLAGCGGTTVPTNPLNVLIEGMSDQGSYTVILDDMDLKDDQYTHRYKVFRVNQDSTVSVGYTKSIPVSENFFFLHEDNIGMELVSRTTHGATNSLVSPPGFTNFVGNKYYGEWKEAFVDTVDVLNYEDSTFWVFNARHQKLAHELGLDGLNITLLEYKEFRDVYLFNRPYYGPKTAPDSTKYGTRSAHMVRYYPGFYRRRTLNRNFRKRYSSSSTGSRGGGGFGK